MITEGSWGRYEKPLWLYLNKYQVGSVFLNPGWICLKEVYFMTDVDGGRPWKSVCLMPPHASQESILEQAAAASEEKQSSLRLRFCSSSFHKTGRFSSNCFGKAFPRLQWLSCPKWFVISMIVTADAVHHYTCIIINSYCHSASIRLIIYHHSRWFAIIYNINISQLYLSFLHPSSGYRIIG